MTRGFTKVVRLGHGTAAHHGNVHKRSTCSSGGFYTAPTSGQTLNSSDPFTITWDTSCLNSTAVDIYLYMPAAETPRIHLWQKVAFAPGQYSTQFKPKWWNDTATANLQLSIVDTGSEPFLSPLPAGPIFTATYTAPADGSVPANANMNVTDPGVEVVDNLSKPSHGPTKGGVAAAVIMPLLIVAALIAGYYIKISRAKGRDKRKRWSEAVDKRMSTISTDWKSITTAGAQAAIRSSMAIPGNRASSFSFGGIRPSSTVAVEGGQAGVGARGLYSQANASIESTSTDAPQMSQLRPGLRSTAYSERTSRVVSFADAPRPSQDRKTVTSRAFHSAFVPPLPTRQNSSGEMSPTQTEGAFTLTADDIRARLSGVQQAQPRPSMDEMMPALSMMRNGGEGLTADDTLLPPPTPEIIAPPLPAHSAPAQLDRSPVMGLMPMQPMPANMMSPDDMLRAYAERRNNNSSPGTFSPPPPSASPSNTMRVLYSPPTAANTLALPTTNPFRISSAPSDGSRYDDDDASGYAH